MTDPTSFLSLVLKIISDRLAVLLALIMTFGLFCWALWAGTNISLIAAVLFAGSVFLPVLWRTSSGNKDG